MVSYRYYPIGMLCSVVFLSATLLVYCLLPELRNIHGLCLMCHMLSLTIGYIFLAIVQLGGSDIPLELCKFLAYTVAFSFLASFYWLNVMCFDIWWVFCGFRKSQMQPSKRGMDSKKFLYYSIYSWGSATAIIILVIATESLPFISEQWLLPKPDFGKTKCWFESKPAMWTYFYGPMASILVANLFFFMTTINKILKISKETRVLTHDGNKRHDEKEKQRYMLYFKLFLVMGITWVSEVVSFHFGSRQSSFVWIVTDVCNTLQGIPIFFIFVWKKKTLRLLNDRFCPSIRLMDASQSSTKTRETTNVTNNNIHSTANKQNVTKMDSSFEMKNLSPNGKVNGER
ncbi:G-protein coupled receptor Mth2 isoform X2 [Nilaparvata lugens]|uniref:G-protein coupled receptor Mth2 isoform X2 n=1 Tax=Nilaparvata lugens TaxID=108931 RepID=UPI00193CB63B|nr:G-protein coupled receptor Mth2 isoform X2 [Nilaparvata lugens]